MKLTNIWEVGFNFDNGPATTKTINVAADTMQDALNNAPKLQASPPSRYTSVKLIATNVHVAAPAPDINDYSSGFTMAKTKALRRVDQAIDNAEGCTAAQVLNNVQQLIRSIQP